MGAASDSGNKDPAAVFRSLERESVFINGSSLAGDDTYEHA
jgi:hypothetical protein